MSAMSRILYVVGGIAAFVGGLQAVTQPGQQTGYMLLLIAGVILIGVGLVIRVLDKRAP